MGVAGIDAVNAMKQAVTEIAQLTDAPLAIDTSDAAALEAGLRAYPGRALINSVSAEDARIRDFLPLAKKYGAAILCLPITEDGVPKTAEARLKTVQFIIGKAKEAGLKDGDFLLDALVMTVSADKDACREVLRTLQLYRQHLGYPATMGLSNISFGLPNRPLINSTFFAMCLAAGLDAPIMNPYDESMQKALKASAALLGDDPCGLAFSQDEGNLAVPRKAAVMKTTDLPILDAIKQAVIEGEKDIIVGLVIQALQEGKTGNEITENGLTAAMTEIGEDFGSGRMFLPQVLLLQKPCAPHSTSSKNSSRPVPMQTKEPSSSPRSRATYTTSARTSREPCSPTPASRSSTSARMSMPIPSYGQPKNTRPISSVSLP